MKALQNSAIFYKMSTYKMPNGQSVNDYVGGGPEMIAKEWMDIFSNLDFFCSDLKYLDFGCGCGRLAPIFEQVLNIGKYTGVDTVSKLIEFCKKEMYTYKHCKFDVVTGNCMEKMRIGGTSNELA
jgi:hypothetical protein